MIRTILGLVIAGLFGTALWGVITSAERRAELQQSEAAIRHLSSTISELRQRYDETDQLLAQTARQRDRLQREAARLAADLSQLPGCPGAAIDAAVVERVRAYRAGDSAGASTQGVD